jgi:hypothetical protein
MKKRNKENLKGGQDEKRKYIICKERCIDNYMNE